MFATEHFGIEPDIMTMAKGLTSGYVPMGVAITKPEIAKVIPIFMHLHTYGEHPVACVVALKNIEIIERERLLENAAEMGTRINAGLKDIQKSSNIIGDVRGLGLWNCTEFVVDKKSKEPFELDAVREIAMKARAKGLICNPMGNSIEFAPPLIIDEKGVDEGLEIMAEVVAAESKG
jgi:adenosylmethionine-8-amino-7-oxononanoate aminotransferase